MSDPNPRARSRRKAPAMSQSSGGGRGYLDEWRADVNQQLDDAAHMLQQANIVLERLTNRLDEYDRRITALEQAPQQRERTVIGVGGLLGNAACVAIALAALLLSVASHISLH